MTLTEISSCERPEIRLQLPNFPEEYFDIIIINNDEEDIEDVTESYPLASSDVSEAKILKAERLTHGNDVKEVYFLELTTNNFPYKPGDTISILTKNRKEDVERLFDHLRIKDLSKKKCKVCEKSPSSKKNTIKPKFIDKVTTLNYLFTYCLDIQSVPKKSLIRVLSEFAKDEQEKRELEELCSKEKSDLYVKQILETNRTFLDLLLMFPSCCPPVARLVENLPKLLPRPYSIASSPLASPGRVKIVFSVIKKEDEREGLCTGMLKSLINERESKVKMFFRKCNGFNLPENDSPLIFIGPGTGIAPFMGFLEHRKLEQRNGKIWMFYGCRYKTKDYLFQKELQEYLDCGTLSKICVAFSRDTNEEAKYVQILMDNLKKFTDRIQKFYELVETQDSQLQEWIKEARKPLHSITNQSAILRAALPKDSICNTALEQFEGFRETLIDNILTSLEEEVSYLQETSEKINVANEALHKEQQLIESSYTSFRLKNLNTEELNPSSPSLEHIVDWCYNVWCYYHSFYLQISQSIIKLNYENEETVTALCQSFKENSELKKCVDKIRSFNLQSFEFVL